MPETEIWFYREADGKSPVIDWLVELRSRDRTAFAKCAAAIRHLGAYGHELRRPHVDFLRDGIYELRIKKGHVNYRILYFFHGRQAIVLAHALTKEQQVAATDIDRALTRKMAFERDPKKHRAMEDEFDE